MVVGENVNALITFIEKYRFIAWTFLHSSALINYVCCLNNQHSFGPLDYESLQQELALKETVWKKVSPESNEDISTTVVYRMESLGEKS